MVHTNLESPTNLLFRLINLHDFIIRTDRLAAVAHILSSVLTYINVALLILNLKVLYAYATLHATPTV